MQIRSLVVCLFFLLLVLGGTHTVGADTRYQISVAGSVDTPTRTVTVEGDSFQVSAIGEVTPGEAIEFSVTAPNDEQYSVYLYDSNRQIVDMARLSGDASDSFSTQDLAAGSYVLVVNGPDGNYRAVHPVVVSAYEVRIDAPETAKTGSEETITATVSAINGTDKAIDHVELMITHNGNDVQQTATKRSEGTYTVTTTVNDPGTYLLYANVRGTEETEGHKELIGVSGASELTVHDPTPTPTSEPTETTSTNQQSGPASTHTPTTTSAPGTISTPTPNATTATPDTPTRTPTTETPVTATETTRETGPKENVITPGSKPQATTRTTVPNRALKSLLFLLLLSGVVARTRQP